MSTPMTAANVAIINDMKKVLEEVSVNREARIKYCYTPTAFTRNRILSFDRIVTLLLNGLKQSLQIELQNFFDHCVPGQSCSKQAFCEQRAKLKPEFFHDWNQVLVSSFYRHYEEKAKRWKGMYLYAVDGSSVPLPETEEMRREYGTVSNGTDKQSAMARICVLYDVLNNIAVRGFLHPWTVSEEVVVPQCLSGLSLENKLLLFDRGYPSYWLMYLLMQKGAKYVMRVSSNASNAVKKFLASQSNDITIDWYPAYSSRKKLRDMGYCVDKNMPLKIRLVKVVLDTGETEVLVTNLYDTQIYTREDLKSVYNLRWGVETCYGHMKQGLQLAQFSGIRQVCVEQDFIAGLLLFNLQSLIENQTEPYVAAVSRKRKYSYRVNRNISWGSLKHRVVRRSCTGTVEMF